MMLRAEAIAALREVLARLASVITPNLPEAAELLRPICSGRAASARPPCCVSSPHCSAMRAASHVSHAATACRSPDASPAGINATGGKDYSSCPFALPLYGAVRCRERLPCVDRRTTTRTGFLASQATATCSHPCKVVRRIRLTASTSQLTIALTRIHCGNVLEEMDYPPGCRARRSAHAAGASLVKRSSYSAIAGRQALTASNK